MKKLKEYSPFPPYAEVRPVQKSARMKSVVFTTRDLAERYLKAGGWVLLPDHEFTYQKPGEVNKCMHVTGRGSKWRVWADLAAAPTPARSACVYCGDMDCPTPTDCPVRRQHIAEDASNPA